MIDFCKHIRTGNESYADLRKKYKEEVQELFKRKGTKVATNEEIQEWLRQRGWTTEELAKAHVPLTIVVRGFDA